jgi:tetratricopeptide (TPR) repeat protein
MRAALVALILATLALTQVIAIGFAQEKLPPPTGHINDAAGVLNAANKQRLETILENLKGRTDLDLVVAIIKSAGNEDLYDYSLRLAGEWNLGPRAAGRKSLLLLITADNGHFFTQFSRAAQADLPDGLIGEMGRHMQPKFESGDYNAGLLSGIQTFATAVGEQHKFTFAELDTQSGETQIAQSRPRTVEPSTSSPTPEAVVTPPVEPSPNATPEASPSASPEASPSATPVQRPTPSPEETPTSSPSATPSPTATIAETPSPSPTETPQTSPTETPQASPAESPTQPASTPDASPAATPVADLTDVAKNSSTRTARPGRTPLVRANPEDEKEQVELALTKRVDERIQLLKDFIASHPKSVAVPRAQELIVAAHATLGDQKLAAGDVNGGLAEFQLALSEVPSEMPDRLFTEVIARIPMNLFVRGQRTAALEAAHQAEGLAKLIPARLLAVTQFYLAIEDAREANRLAELTVQNAPDLAAAHQALGAARHIALRLDDAEAEYARALALNAKSISPKLALADLKRAGGKTDEALALYRQVFEVDPKNNSARAGIVLSLLELGKKDEAEQELTTALASAETANNLPLLVGAAYWFVANGNADRALDLAQKAVTIEPRYSWAQITLARALVAKKRPLEAERALRFARQFASFPSLNYELATVLASVGLYDEAAAELARSFSLKNGQIETKLGGRTAASAATFTELLAPERRAAIFQSKSADTEANAKTLKGLLAFSAAMNSEARTPSEDDLSSLATGFIAGDDAMRTYRQVYVANKLLKKGIAFSTVLDLMDAATAGVDAALNVPAATVAVQADELADTRASALAQGGTPDVPDAPPAALSGLLRGKIEDIAGLALLNLDKSADAVARLRRAVSVSPIGTPLWRAAMWHLGTALESTGKYDQALLYYTKSYLAGAADAARRSVIERVYLKVNGTMDGLDEKIGPAFSSARPSATPNR